MNTALKVDYRDQQWADLAILKEACIARPETCGTAGAAIVFIVYRPLAKSTCS